MPSYSVTFTQNYVYDVEATNEDEALKKAHKIFINDMCNPIANTCYDDCEIEENEETF